MNSGIGLATTGDMPTNIGSGIFKADCKLGMVLISQEETKQPTNNS
ncbi:MAG: hypothetical protein R2883_08665 [Caldisericia bacterium]